MKDIENTKKEAPLKESPFLGLTGMGGGVGSLMWKSGAPLLKHTFWTWGSNEYGQLGQNNRTNYSSPIQVGAREDWARVQQGYGTALIRNDNTLWTWGKTEDGMLGHNVGKYGGPSGNTLQLEGLSSPTQVGGDSDGWNYAAFGRGHGIFTKTDGTIWGCGGNDSGQLGLNTPGGSGTYRYSSPVQLFGTSTKFKEPQLTFPYSSASLVIDDDSNLWAMGYNHYGILGLNDAHNKQISSPTQIPGSWAFISGNNEIASFGVKTDGTRWGWGRNWAGQLGNGDKTARSSPVQIPGTWSNGGTAYHTIATTPSGTMYANGSGSGGALGLNSNTYHETPQQIPGTNWQFASVATNRNLASRTNGTIWTWGAGNYGNLGHNENTSYSSPKQIPGTWDVTDQWSGGQGYICGGVFKKV